MSRGLVTCHEIDVLGEQGGYSIEDGELDSVINLSLLLLQGY